jgi:hypothetical protein
MTAQSLSPVAILSISNISDAVMHSIARGGLVVSESDLSPTFFDLKSGFAGEVLQKFVNYKARLAIILSDQNAYGERFSELAQEHRNHPSVRFFATAAEAHGWLAAK